MASAAGRLTAAPSALAQGAALLGLWLILSGGDAYMLAVGVVTSAAASMVSIRLLPPGAARLRPLPLLGLILRFLEQSIVAGVDVARRALDPRLPVNPGFAHYRLRLAPGGARSAFLAASSLLPGTLPAAVEADGSVLVHCLDVRQSAEAAMADFESRFVSAVRDG